MTPEQKKNFTRDIQSIVAMTGSRRDGTRRFANKVDFSFEGVNEWRRSVGLPELTRKEFESR